MSKLSQAKTDLNFLKKKIDEISDVLNSSWYSAVWCEYSKRDLEALKRCYTYCETYIKLLEIKKLRKKENAERVEKIITQNMQND